MIVQWRSDEIKGGGEVGDKVGRFHLTRSRITLLVLNGSGVRGVRSIAKARG